MKFWILLYLTVLLAFTTDENSFVEGCGDGPPCEESPFKHPLDKIYEAEMITKEEVKNLEDGELKRRKHAEAKSITGSLGMTKFFETDSGDFLVKKSLKEWDTMDDKDKYYQTKHLNHEKEMYEKLKDVDGILKVFSDRSSIESIVMESMSMDGLPVLIYLLKKRKNVSNEFLINFLKLLRPLAEMHERGITHNDISIENVMYKNGNWKFIDFDLARENFNEYPTKGHREYWSPEQQHYNKKQKSLDVFTKFERIKSKVANLKKEDVYALGIASLILTVPRPLGLQMNQDGIKDYGAFKFLIYFLIEKNQLMKSGQRVFLKNRQYDDCEEFTWEEYHRYLVDFIPDLYDPKLKNLIANMIHPDSENRTSAKDALHSLNEIIKNQKGYKM